MLTKKQMEKFAELAVLVGANMQPKQEVVIRCDVQCADFAHLIAEKAYKFGAKRVHIQWEDEVLARIEVLKAGKSALKKVPEYVAAQYKYFIKHKVCLISIKAGNPNIFKGCKPDKLDARQLALLKSRKEFRNATMSNYLRWTIVSIPTVEWAKQVFQIGRAHV